ncbi:hypothetical protein [Saccharothrix coeruleofusca]|nr:hypothetical protein [Saccharothrix coeruleofusca]
MRISKPGADRQVEAHGNQPARREALQPASRPLWSLTLVAYTAAR